MKERNPLLGALIELRECNALQSLQRICRTAIRRRLKAKADDSIASLQCLPLGLKSFLLVDDEPMILSCQSE